MEEKHEEVADEIVSVSLRGYCCGRGRSSLAIQKETNLENIAEPIFIMPLGLAADSLSRTRSALASLL
jgi:hypothetical protein